MSLTINIFVSDTEQNNCDVCYIRNRRRRSFVCACIIYVYLYVYVLIQLKGLSFRVWCNVVTTIITQTIIFISSLTHNVDYSDLQFYNC